MNKQSNFFIILTLIVCIPLVMFGSSQDLKKVTLQLQWKHQFQFAGYYMAKEKGYYKNAGLDVEIKEFEQDTNVLKSVVNKEVDFGIGRSSLILDANKDILLLAAIFQSSPYILHAIERDDIKTLDDVANKTIMMPDNLAMMASINAMLKAKGLVQNSFKVVPHTFNIMDLVNKKVDFATSYISNEPYILNQLGYKSTIFDPKDYGFDFYDDILFTRKSLVQEDPHLVHQFYEASLKGWQYAFENIEQTVELILEKYNTQNKAKEHLLFEANTLKDLAIPEGKKDVLGLIEVIRLREIDNTFRLLGLKRDYSKSLQDIVYSPSNVGNSELIYTNEQLQYLAKKKSISMCVDPNWLPFEKIENGKHVGMSADYLAKLETKIGVPFELVPTKTWSESIQFAKQRKCDIYSLAMSTPERLKYMNFTQPYLNIPLVVVTRINEPFMDKIQDILDKQFISAKGYAFVELLRLKYPQIKIKEVQNMHEALKMVRSGEGYGVIGSLAGLGYQIQKEFTGELKVNGKFNQLWELGIGSRNDEPLLNSILNKAIQSMSPSVQREIINKWISIKVEEKVNIKTLLMVAIPIIVIIVTLLYWTRKMSHEIQLRKKAQNEANEAYKEIQNLLDVTLEGIVLFKDGKCFKVNEQAVNIFGYKSKEEMIGLHLNDFIAESSIDTVMENFVKKAVEPYHTVGLKASNEEFPILARGQNFEGQNTQYRVSTILDMTELKDKEEMLIKQSKMVALGEMLGNIAHQWRQPLSVISLNASGIKFKKEFGEISDEEVMYLCNSINENAQYLSQTIDDFRDFLQNNKKKDKFNVSTNIDRSISLIEGMLKKHEINIVKNIDEELQMFGYDSEFTQVMMNILNNAKDALVENNIEEKYIFIEANEYEDVIEVVVKDNAGGIPNEYLKRIFEPYFTTKHQSQGTGIGLFMSYEIITKHIDGTIKAKNSTFHYKGNELTGAQFTISVPVVKSNEEE